MGQGRLQHPAKRAASAVGVAAIALVWALLWLPAALVAALFAFFADVKRGRLAL